MLTDEKSPVRSFPEKARSGFRRIVTSVGNVSEFMRADLKAAHDSFKHGSDNLALLNNPPLPAEMIARVDEQVSGLIGAVKGSVPKDFYSFPSVHNYRFPEHGLTLAEARRTFSTSPHVDYYDQVVGLHIISTNDRKYYYKVTTFQPSQEPFHLLNRAQTDPDLNPRHVLERYGLTVFNFDEIPPSMNNEVVTALHRTGLL